MEQPLDPSLSSQPSNNLQNDLARIIERQDELLATAASISESQNRAMISQNNANPLLQPIGQPDQLMDRLQEEKRDHKRWTRQMELQIVTKMREYDEEFNSREQIEEAEEVQIRYGLRREFKREIDTFNNELERFDLQMKGYFRQQEDYIRRVIQYQLQKAEQERQIKALKERNLKTFGIIIEDAVIFGQKKLIQPIEQPVRPSQPTLPDLSSIMTKYRLDVSFLLKLEQFRIGLRSASIFHSMQRKERMKWHVQSAIQIQQMEKTRAP
ncbi:hypothetical protein FGO68_gene15991 [Halteria grandinella]|uniref:Uncharacterized protein n=1 Tax=Halteria grandinella TaxID=5974 RepID=A0A8J8T018_HALGN|nr:hypothetical protein FGO68_gene15991 [Halteria grandinella]